ncbi:hypothetical protein TRIUR3_11015 [Triticum urartu]|uniref:Disease resistance N-terminal domain-containing protein n=1 Tax=Triticum urartu TaxID=4572 RepID=M7ZJU8_TRIUA|nr:hypothetical protein TRIUR3_11015 [Triticum urartu]
MESLRAAGVAVFGDRGISSMVATKTGSAVADVDSSRPLPGSQGRPSPLLSSELPSYRWCIRGGYFEIYGGGSSVFSDSGRPPAPSVGPGVMNALLCKLSKLLEDEYSRLKGVRRQITFLRDELSSMNAVLETLADAEQLDPLKREWRDKELRTCLKGFFSKLRKLKARREIADEIEQLKIRTIEASERRRRYDFLEPAQSSGASSAVDPRLPALYEDAARLVGIDGPKEHILGWFCKEKEHDDLKG